MQTVKAWAHANNFEYRFFDDSFFNYAPEWYRQKVNHQICPVTDLARLIVAKNFLSEGYERTIWIDADVLIFAPSKLIIDVKTDFAMCYEIWIYKETNGRWASFNRINNSIAVFTRNSIHLDFFIDACLRIAHQKSSVGKLDVGTAFFSHLGSVLPFPLLMNNGIFSPTIITEIAAGGGPYLSEYARNLKVPVACANFCASLAGTGDPDPAQHERIYEAAIANCMATQGDVINRLIPSPST